MKKKVITLLLSLVLASGSIDNVQVLAADTTEQEAESVQEAETAEQEEESAEEPDTENASEDISKPEEEAESAQENEEQVQEDEDSETEEAVDEEEADISEEAAAEVLETEETEITDESEDELTEVVDSGSCGENATWTLTGAENDLTLTISGSGDMENYLIDSVPWTSQRENIKKVVIEEGITSVGNSAFCSFKKLPEMSLPNSITYIGSFGFDNCVALKNIKIPDSVTNIGDYAFSNCGFASIIIPDSITDIGEHAFSGCSSLTSIIIPDSVTNIGDYAFSGCRSLTSIKISDSVTIIGEFTFSYCSNLENITIPDSVTSIGIDAFSGCRSLKCITIPDSVTNIGYGAFRNCRSLTSITIPDSVTSIGEYGFSGCSSLSSITIPNSMTSIYKGTFQNCSNLESITIPNSITLIGSDYDYSNPTFDGCNKLNKINISDIGAWCRIEFYEYVPGNLYLNGNPITEVTIPDGITKIDSYHFKGRSTIKSITIPNSVRRISNGSFSGCSDLTSITIPGSITTIGKWFLGCKNLKSVTILNGVTNIDKEAFSGCSSLSSITIPDSVTSIGEQSFNGCDSLKSLTIPNSVSSIDWEAFPRKYWERNNFVIFTQSTYVKNYCYLNYYAYFDKSAPSIAKITSYNGSDMCVYFEKKDEAIKELTVFGNDCVLGYQIKYADNKNMTDAKSIMLKDKKAESKTITGLKSGKTYYVQIQHYLNSGNISYWSKWSPIKNVTVGQTPYPTNVSKLSTYIGSHIKVDWTKTAGVSGYHIKYADNSSMTGAKEVMVKGNSTFTKTLTGLKNGQTYYVKIQTYRTVSGKTYWSSWSPAKSIKVDQKPYGSSISKLANPSSKAMKITWDKAPSATGYHIQYATNSGMTGAKDIMVNNKDTLSKTVTGLTKGKTYYVRIQTFRKVSGKTYWSSWSKAKQIKITK